MMWGLLGVLRTSNKPFQWLVVSWNIHKKHCWLEKMVGGVKTTPSIVYLLKTTLYTATNFAVEMGFEKQDLHTNKSRYWQHVC